VVKTLRRPASLQRRRVAGETPSTRLASERPTQSGSRDAERVTEPTQIYQNITDSLRVPFRTRGVLARIAVSPQRRQQREAPREASGSLGTRPSRTACSTPIPQSGHPPLTLAAWRLQPAGHLTRRSVGHLTRNTGWSPDSTLTATAGPPSWKPRCRYEDPAGSNVVEAVIRSLRRKLESTASAIETVRGLGYRVNTHTLAQTSEHGDG
jgi:hypothetical protein